MSNQSFDHWLAHQSYRLEDSVGKIAHRAKKDDWPRTQSFSELEAWALDNLDFDGIRGLKRAYVEYLLHTGHELKVEVVQSGKD